MARLQLIANLILPIAVLVFASGFFPYKPFLPGLAKYEALTYGSPPAAPFDKVVFMVVDALRSDFVFLPGTGFSFTQSLIANGAAIPFTAHATSPTITMPRIKAITTGSIPSFLDVILNFAESDTSSTLATQDTWLAQMKAQKKGKLVMYGDDTWLKLFPETFDRADGTTSFFVSDFTEVDNNVTRHVPEELGNSDWHTMVLHYLGLDHIGHKAGPQSPNMIPKQREMDAIVQQIYEAMESKSHLKSTLLILCGDHGMNDAGNHGGSAPGETSPALVFMSPKFKKMPKAPHEIPTFREDFQYYTSIEQSDIAPTLGALLGFPIPKNNLGAFITEFLSFWPKAQDQRQILLENAMQILGIVRATFPAAFEKPAVADCSQHKADEDRLACEWKKIEMDLNSKKTIHSKDVLQKLETWTKMSQDIMRSTASNYDIPKLITGLVLAVISVALSLYPAIPVLASAGQSSIPFIGMTILYGVMMFASSYVEEEQNFWYWASSGWLAFLTVKGLYRYSNGVPYITLGAFGAFAALRIARRWNQTGQKFAGEPDITRGYLNQNPLILWDLVMLAYLWNCQFLSMKAFTRFPRAISGFFSAAVLVIAITFKVAFTNEDAPELIVGLAQTVVDLTSGVTLVTRARAAFAAIALALAYTVKFELLPSPSKSRHREDAMWAIHCLISLFLMTQSRASNAPLILLFDIQLFLLSNIRLNLLEITTTTLLLQHASFFALGNSNAISSIDLSSAYNGVSGYNVLVVGILVFFSNWAGPVFWVSASTLLFQRIEADRATYQKHLTLVTFFVAASVLAVMAACTILRTHLFIWTVFSPKYLYCMAWTLGQHLLINLGMGSLLFWLGSR